MQCIYFAVAFLVLFVNVVSSVHIMDKWFSSKCYQRLPWPKSVCKRYCPQLFSDGRCEYHNEKWQCICKSSEKDTNEYTIEEANCVQRVSDGEQNPECVSQLCPLGFQDSAEIVKEQREWQWYCNAKEFKSHRPSKYTLVEANRIHHACNSPRGRETNACKKSCPVGYERGDCFVDQKSLVRRCGCAQLDKLSDLYGVKEANDIVGLCSDSVQSHAGCAELCPIGFDRGRCRGEGHKRYCGCKQQEDSVGWYTISQAREMAEVCNSKRQDDEECRGLCPVGYKRNGRCAIENGHAECQCVRDVDYRKWLPLNQAIKEYKNRL